MYDDDDEVRDTPPAVIAAVASGVGPLPFLAVYATLFIIHGGFHHVIPPDVTDSNRGELLVGLGCLVVFVITLVTLLWLLNRSRRWPFVIVQAALFAVSVDFLVDETKGGRFVSGLVAVTTLLAVVLSMHPQAWEHLGWNCPRIVARIFGRKLPPKPAMPAGSSATSDTVPTSARLVGRRRKRAAEDD